ncbi:HTTM domain-containing protein [Blastopirellula retiformator]|uniref:Sporulation-delaying protein SdpB n=1 Tax=Blastopirellula retiformator TaxID=2527970 RepID=A0A5C5V0H0_9BACT|nr:HTTM domain-containing protein [Blastopirellula retiformator]TWT31881.1 Sporulation-delaying protein SdpB [Blastopirellula retiformator]
MIRQYLQELYRGVVGGWNRFWFTPTDPATLGVIRILGGAMIFYTHLVWSIDLVGFMGASGRFSADLTSRMQGQSPFAWSYLPLIDDSPALLWTAHIIALVILAMFMVGFKTRITGVLTFIITMSYVHRAPGALFGLDQVNGMLATYLMLGAAGEAYSVDHWLKRKRNVRMDGPRESTIANISIRLIQIHMCIIYLFAGLSKLGGETWWDGSAMWGAVANSEYQSLDMTWLAAYPILINLLTQISLAWEISYTALVWPRLTRPLVIGMAIPLHLGIAVAMGMITFGLAMLIANMAFISPWIIRRIEAAIAERLAK